jgi:low affinity Fe/Cu permease
MQNFFSRFTSVTSAILGRAWMFMLAAFLIIVWLISGPIFGFSDTWQLIINTSTTIITFLMVFIIQNTQNRDNNAINIKLDVMMRKLGITAKDLIEAEEQSDKMLEKQKLEIQHSRGTKHMRQNTRKTARKT